MKEQPETVSNKPKDSQITKKIRPPLNTVSPTDFTGHLMAEKHGM
jgi:hypothetical protein